MRLTLLLLFLPTLAAAADVQLKARCRPAGPVVTLGDVAEVSAADRQQADAMAAIELFPAPLPGKQRALGFRELQDLLVARQVRLGDHRFSGASEVTVLGDGQPSPDSGRQEQAAASGAKRSERRASPNVDPQGASGVVVAVVSLPKGAVVRASDVRLEAAASDVQSAGFPSLEEVVGREVARAVPAGAVVPAQAIRPLLLVHRGEFITVYARAAGILVRTKAKAQDDGAMGDVVPVESLGNRKKYAARVCGAQEAEVEVPGARPEAAGPEPQHAVQRAEYRVPSAEYRAPDRNR